MIVILIRKCQNSGKKPSYIRYEGGDISRKRKFYGIGKRVFGLIKNFKKEVL